MTFLTNRVPRLISLMTSAIFVSGTSGSKSPCSNFIIIIIITPLEFFTSVLADGFSLEFE